ncbi:MAG TPA: hypothetical protein EYP05_01315 [Piscirickettsiaceae bacterium]|nr:hypothetical protein [Piscirickettsiaceae bacterium]
MKEKGQNAESTAYHKYKNKQRPQPLMPFFIQHEPPEIFTEKNLDRLPLWSIFIQHCHLLPPPTSLPTSIAPITSSPNTKGTQSSQWAKQTDTNNFS